jgi:hypothetical protein
VTPSAIRDPVPARPDFVDWSFTGEHLTERRDRTDPSYWDTE